MRSCSIEFEFNFKTRKRIDIDKNNEKYEISGEYELLLKL